MPRITVPNGFASNYFDAYATCDVGSKAGLEVGWKWNRIAREFRETEHTTENMFRVAADVRPSAGFTARGIYEHGACGFPATSLWSVALASSRKESSYTRLSCESSRPGRSAGASLFPRRSPDGARILSC